MEKLKTDEMDILYDVANEYLEEIFNETLDFINSDDFKNELKNRLNQNGVSIEFKDMNQGQEINGLFLPKYRINNFDTIECIVDDIKEI